MFFKRLSKKKQTNRNKAAFEALCDAGFSQGDARRALIAGNRLRIKKLAETALVSAPTIYAAAYGRRNNRDGQAALAKAFDMEVHELFPEINQHDAQSN